MVPLEVQALAGLETVEDGLDGLHVLAQLGYRRVPSRGVALLDIGLYLRAQPQFKAPAGHLLQVPAGNGRDHGAPGESDEHAGAHDQPFCGVEGQGRQQQAIVHGVRHVQAVETHGFRAGGVVADISRPHGFRCGGEDFKHGLTPVHIDS